MIVWINGSFGVGKTTVAEKLKEQLKNSFIYDPEEIGVFLSKIMSDKKMDFQDYELWRTLNFEILKYLSKKYLFIIVPMTITNKQYYKEIVERLRIDGIVVRAFILDASREVIIERLNKRGNSTKWAYEQVDRCVKSFYKDFDGIKIDTNNEDVLGSTTLIINNLYNDENE